MTERASVVVIGGGVIGASVAYNLAKLGRRDVTVVDAGEVPGSGSTGRATGGFRAQFGTRVNVSLSLFSRARLSEFREETGVDPGYRPVGYLWIASSHGEMEILRAAQRVQQAGGLADAAIVAVDDISRLNPAVSTEGALGGAFCPTDGYIAPMEILRGYREGAVREGVRVRQGARCTGFRIVGDRIASVILDNGVIETDTVVNAAGAWASHIGTMAGMDLPVRPSPVQAAFTVPTTAIPDSMPMTLYCDSGFHLRVRDGRALLCWPREEIDGYDLSVDPEWLDAVDEMKRQRVPALRDVPLARELAYAGLYERSPDGHAIVGWAPECRNLYLVNGSSGHGVMHSPALGAITAAEITGNAAPVDAAELRPTRFREGRLITGPSLL